MARKTLILTVLAAILIAHFTYLYYEYINMQVPDKLFYNTSQFTSSFGYATEEYNVTTPDGGSLITFRLLPKGRNLPSRGVPILFVQGLFGSSDFVTISGPGKNLVYQLTDEGYDVWLSNDRATVYFDAPSQPVKRGFYEIGTHDLVAIVDRIRDQTGYEKIALMSMSLGGGKSLAMLSEKPQYNDKLALALHLTPAVCTNMRLWTHKGVTFFLAKTGRAFQNIRERIGWSGQKPIKGIYFICTVLMPSVCSTMMESFKWNATSEISLITFIKGSIGPFADLIYDMHQNMNYDGKDFKKMDFGPEENMKLYNSVGAPSYDLSRVTVPTKLYYVNNDDMIDNEASSKFFNQLPNIIGEATFYNYACHIDVLVNSSSDTAFIGDIFQTLNAFTTKIKPKPPS